MQKLKSFDQFSTEVKISQTRKLEEDKLSKRQNEAETFKTLLAEFDVTSIKDLTKEQRVEFFTKLKGTELNESTILIEEGTRGQIGKIDKKGNITSVYMQYDSYPENILPHLSKGFKNGKNVDELIKKGSFSGLEASIDKINFYGKPGHMTGSAITDADIKKYLTKTSNEESAEFVYLWDEGSKQWMMADTYANTGLVPAFESLVTEGQHGMAKKLLNSVIDGDTSRAEGVKMSKELAQHYLYWITTSPYGKKNENLPLEMLVKASFNWGIERQLPTTLKKELATLKDSVKESLEVNEAAKFKNTKNFEDFLEEIDGMGDAQIKKIMGRDYIDTPGYYSEEAEEYDNDIIEFMISNMGRKEFEKLQDYWENNVAESRVNEALSSEQKMVETFLKKIAKEFDYSIDDAARFVKDTINKMGIKESRVNEAEINSDKEFTEYAMTVLKKAFGAEFDEAKAKKVADGILAKSKGDYGTAIGMLTSSLGESVTNEALKASKPDDVETVQLDMSWDEEDKEEDKAAKGAFKKFKIKVEPTENDGAYDVTGKKKDILAYLQSEFYDMDDETVEEYYPELLEGHSYNVYTIKEFKASNEAIDTKYWADYNNVPGPSWQSEKSKDLDKSVSVAVAAWNDEAEDDENTIDDSQIKKIKKLAKEYFKKEGWISFNVVQAMIMQES